MKRIIPARYRALITYTVIIVTLGVVLMGSIGDRAREAGQARIHAEIRQRFPAVLLGERRP